MKKVIEKNKTLLILNCLFAVLVVAQETHLIDVFPIDDQWKVPIKGTYFIFHFWITMQ